jgi:histidinol-phosphate aminotransferase
MSLPPMSRRRFAGAVGGALGGALLAPRLAAATTAAPAAATAADPAAAGPLLLNSNENPYGPSAKALEAMTGSQAIAARYPDAAEDAVVAAIARHHGVATEQVVLGCGSSEILRLAIDAWTAKGRPQVVAEPTFEAVLRYVGATGADTVKVPLDAAFRHDLDAMAKACNAGTGLVYVCNPNNPTGTIVPGDALQAFLARVPATATVVVDEAYHHFVEDPAYASAAGWLDRFPNLVVARTFSKIYGLAGMRLGYAIGSKAKCDELRRQAFFSPANAAVLAAALASLDDEAHVADQRRKLNGTRHWLCAELDKDGRRYMPSETNFVMIHLGTDVTPVIEAFKQRGILVGRRFPPLPDWLRISIGTQAEIEVFAAALKEIVPAGRRAA